MRLHPTYQRPPNCKFVYQRRVLITSLVIVINLNKVSVCFKYIGLLHKSLKHLKANKFQLR